MTTERCRAWSSPLSDARPLPDRRKRTGSLCTASRLSRARLQRRQRHSGRRSSRRTSRPTSLLRPGAVRNALQGRFAIRWMGRVQSCVTHPSSPRRRHRGDPAHRRRPRSVHAHCADLGSQIAHARPCRLLYPTARAEPIGGSQSPKQEIASTRKLNEGRPVRAQITQPGSIAIPRGERERHFVRWAVIRLESRLAEGFRYTRDGPGQGFHIVSREPSDVVMLFHCNVSRLALPAVN